MCETIMNMRFRMVVPGSPAFNVYTRMTRRTTSLGAVSVASAVNTMDGWEAEVIDENNYRKPGPQNDEGRPEHSILNAARRADVVGLYGGLSSTIPRLFEVANYYKQTGCTIIAGGQHFTGNNVGEALANGIDFIALGEGEDTIRELLTAIQTGQEPDGVHGIAFLRDGQMVVTPLRAPIRDFDRLPQPDFGLVQFAKIDIYPVGWTRGCGMDCEFCTVKGRPRSCSVERVVTQITSLVEAYGARRIFMVDDLFGHRREDTLRLCEQLAEYQKTSGKRLDLRVQIRLDRAGDAELLKAMRRAGITSVFVGYESPIAEELAAMNKKIKPEEMIAMTRLYHKAGFLVHGMFIFGYPLPDDMEFHLSADERVQRFRVFIRAARLDTIQVVLPIPLPGAELTDRLEAQNRVFARDHVGWEYYDGSFPLFKPDEPLTAEEMQSASLKIMGRFYRFRSMFGIVRNILVFPAMIFSIWNLQVGWRKWYRFWRNDLLRFGGWIIYKRWTSMFRSGSFSEKLVAAKRHLQGVRKAASRRAASRNTGMV